MQNYDNRNYILAILAIATKGPKSAKLRAKMEAQKEEGWPFKIIAGRGFSFVYS